MTRYLSQALGAIEPRFGHGIDELEQASGKPGADIRLSTEVVQRVRAKIAELGLDPSDTTGPELYEALHLKLEQDERTVRGELGIAADAAADVVVSRAQQFLASYDVPCHCFAVKASVMKRLLKKKVPKNAMKALGYRSADSMLKHEPVAQILALAQLVESHSWRTTFQAQYTKLQPTDFESRESAVFAPASQRWVKAASAHVTENRHNIIICKEVGAVIVLPLAAAIDGLAITTILLVLHALNDIRAYSSYIKLQQVRTDFGTIIRTSMTHEPLTSAKLAGRAVPWRMVQRYYGQYADAYHPEVFEPYVQPDDLSWHHAEEALAGLSPELAFWRDTQHIAALHEGQPVSLNVLDVALSYCNHLPFKQRIVHFVRDHLWHELMMRYLNQQNLEAAVAGQLGAGLVPEQALVE